MPAPAPRYDVNCSILLTHLPLLARPQAARDAGFDAVEFWWPFAEAVPSDREVDAFVRSVRDAGVQVVALNTYGGDLAAGDRGLLSVPGREDEFRDNLHVAAGLAAALGIPALHALYGNRDGTGDERQDALALQHLDLACRAASEAGAVVVLEALSGVPAYPLRTAADVLGVLDRLERGGQRSAAGWLCDLYHLAVNGDDLDDVVTPHVARIAHVQIADAPGRHQPGTGELPLKRHVEALYVAGYAGWVGLEYVPLGDPDRAFDWLPRDRRAGRTSG